MMRHFIFILSLLLTTITQAAVTAEIDRTNVAEGESITLTLSSDASNNSPDLSILSANFDVLGTSQSNSFSIVNGSMSSQHTWTIQLMPKQVGTIIIPSITIGNEKTTPITIEVTSRKSTPNNTNNSTTISSTLDDMFFETTVDKNKAYVQEQIIYTQRFYFRPEIRIADISIDDLSVENASVEPLNTKGPKYQKEINGVTYQVIEGTYAVFPEKSGELHIPARQLTVQMQTGMFNPPRIARLTSDEKTITVLPQSTNQLPWLPAQALSINEQWSTALTDIKIGESITRKITVEAKGLSQSHLPGLPDTKIDHLKIYADKPETNNTVTSNGIIGTRTDSMAIVATKPGTYTLPPISIKWWNTVENVEQIAELPAVSFTVVDNPNQPTTLPAPSANNVAPSNNTLSQNNMPISPSDTAWKYLAIALLVLWLLTVLLWWRARLAVKHENTNAQPKALLSNAIPSRSSTLHELLNACQENNAAKAREALLLWGKERWSWSNAAFTLADIALQAPSLSHEINLLEQSLYGKLPNNWQGNSLLKLIKEMPHHTTNKHQEKSPLAPLYPMQ